MTKEEAIKRLIDETCKYRLYCELYPDDCMKEECEIYMAIEALRERPTGKWILEEQKSQNHIENIYICSSCRNFEAWGKTELYNYCPICGAEMRGERDEHIKERTDANV